MNGDEHRGKMSEIRREKDLGVIIFLSIFVTVFVTSIIVALSFSRATIKSVPMGAKVYVDGEFKGVTPLETTVSGLPWTSTKIEIKKHGYYTETSILPLGPFDTKEYPEFLLKQKRLVLSAITNEKYLPVALLKTNYLINGAQIIKLKDSIEITPEIIEIIVLKENTAPLKYKINWDDLKDGPDSSKHLFITSSNSKLLFSKKEKFSYYKKGWYLHSDVVNDEQLENYIVDADIEVDHFDPDDFFIGYNYHVDTKELNQDNFNQFTFHLKQLACGVLEKGEWLNSFSKFKRHSIPFRDHKKLKFRMIAEIDSEEVKEIFVIFDYKLYVSTVYVGKFQKGFLSLVYASSTGSAETKMYEYGKGFEIKSLP